ncbi:DNA helicase [Tanacetum coccineum]
MSMVVSYGHMKLAGEYSIIQYTIENQLFKSWHQRQIKTKKSLGRLTYVYPSSCELFYFRMLLCHMKGSKSTIEVRTVHDQILLTYQDACEALDPPKLWTKHWQAMHFGLETPPHHLLKDLKNKLLKEEKNYKHEILMQHVDESVPKLNHDHKKIYNLIINASATNQQELLFVYSHGGTGKTFLLKTIISSLRSQGKIVLAVASSGITYAVNAKILSTIEGQSRTYLSNDEAIPMGRETTEIELLYPMECLNTITFPSFPPNELQLKNTIASLRIGQQNYVLEAKVYRKWISKSVPDMKELAFYCILIDKEANMDINNTDYFNPLLRARTVYRFSNFICEKTQPYLQTLENKISLKFGKITTFDILQGKESEFPEHHFKFVVYNQLASRVLYRDANSKMIYPLLTNYQGCIRSIIDVTPFGDVNKGQSHQRKVDIKNLELTGTYKCIYSDVVETLSNLQCGMNLQDNVQLSATSASHYYINPRTPEAEYAYTVFKEKYNLNPPLQGILFTCEAMITAVAENRDGNYSSCSQCNKKMTKQNDTYTCEDHGIQDPPTYRYNFKATVTDGSVTAQFTFFTNAGEKITGHPCS